jgi:hypothetical protein
MSLRNRIEAARAVEAPVLIEAQAEVPVLEVVERVEAEPVSQLPTSGEECRLSHGAEITPCAAAQSVPQAVQPVGRVIEAPSPLKPSSGS